MREMTAPRWLLTPGSLFGSRGAGWGTGARLQRSLCGGPA